jgi:hypothetical protein
MNCKAFLFPVDARLLFIASLVVAEINPDHRLGLNRRTALKPFRRGGSNPSLTALSLASVARLFVSMWMCDCFYCKFSCG